MIEELKSLYINNQSRFKEIVDKFPEKDLAGPFLMCPNEKYQNQSLKVLIIGQETKGWGYYFDDIEGGMKMYEDFNLGEKYYSSPFWNITRKTEYTLTKSKFNCAWTNLSKYDVEAARPYGEYLESISRLDNILLEEIRIIKPNIILFFTGPTLDYRIKNIFPKIVFSEAKGFNTRQVAILRHCELPDKSFRTYHPRYLRQSGLESKFIEFLKLIKHNKSLNQDTRYTRTC